MNVKIFNKLQEIIKNSPQVMTDKQSLKVAIGGTFGVNLAATNFDTIYEMTEVIDNIILENYFAKVWQPQTKKYKFSGLGIVDEINTLKPLSVVDLGCGYNEFKGKIDNLIGVDPYNDRADIKSSITQYMPEQKHDIAIVLGSINFGSADKILFELVHVVNNIVKPGGLIFFRANPGKMHEAPEAQWIDFFEWTPEFIVNSARALGCIPVICSPDNDRLYFVWKTRDDK